jgi:hypothetical protein
VTVAGASADALAADECGIVWTSTLTGAPTSSVFACYSAKCSVPEVVAAGETRPQSYALDASGIYWANTSAIMHASR